MSEKKILVITYYWPPAGGPGVQRWLKFAKYLPDFGWQPTVFIPENPSYPIVDESLTDEVPTETEIIKRPILEPYRWAEKLSKSNKKFKAGQFDIGENQSRKAKLSIFIRGNFFIPDARIFWVKPSIRFLTKYLKENHFDAVVTTGPPHSLHLIGLGLKKEFPDLKWVADFRDPWTEISYYRHLKLTAWADRKHRRLENKVFKTADITLATSYTDAENFRKKGANATCITNGFDATPQTSKAPNSKFTISYVGVLEQLRNPDVLWTVLQELIKTDDDFAKHFRLRFTGRVDDKIMQALQQSALGEHITDVGYVSHAEAYKEMEQADLLLISNFPDERSQGIIPGKIFEYLSTGNSVISFGPADSDVRRILDETGAGKHFGYADHEAVKTFVLGLYTEWQQGDVTRQNRDIDKFSRRNLTARLADILNK